MVAVQRIAQTRAHYVGINFGGREVGMAQHGLQTPQIGPAFQ